MPLRPLPLALLVLSAVFGLACFPLVTRFSRGLVSPYAKADVRKRFAAAGVDVLVAGTCVAGFSASGAAPLVLLGAGYLLFRDALPGGQSLGKLLFGLGVVRVDGASPCTVGRSVRRNLLWLIPGLNLVAGVLEAQTIQRDPLGLRLGDRLARTQVVQGKDARDLVQQLQWRLLHPQRGNRPQPQQTR